MSQVQWRQDCGDDNAKSRDVFKSLVWSGACVSNPHELRAGVGLQARAVMGWGRKLEVDFEEPWMLF